MANPSAQNTMFADGSNNGLLSAQQSNVPTYDITWTANEPTAASTTTIADGDVPTVAELGQVTADLTAKLNAVIAVLEAHGLTADA